MVAEKRCAALFDEFAIKRADCALVTLPTLACPFTLFFELGANRWIDVSRYPVPQTRVRTLWLAGGKSGTAPGSLNDGVLASRRPARGLRAGQ